jgi:hypothetical protein
MTTIAEGQAGVVSMVENRMLLLDNHFGGETCGKSFSNGSPDLHP